MIKQIARATLMVWTTFVAGQGLAYAAPEGYERILVKREAIKFKGHKVAVPIELWLKTRFAEDVAYFDLWADADLSGFQDKAPKIAGRMARHRVCGDRITVSNVSLAPTKEKARLCVRVRYEKWQCLQAAMPGLNGFNLTFKKSTVAKTRLVAQNGHICADMWPEVSETGREVKLKGKVTKNAVGGQTGLFGDLFNVRSKFRSRLRSEINRAMSGLKLPVPLALQSFDPVLDDAKFRTREDGSLGMVLTMRVKVTPTELPQILSRLSSN